MGDVTQILETALGGFLIALAGLIAIHLLTGQINMSGLLMGKGGGSKPTVSPGRVQLLIATLVVAANYVSMVMKQPALHQLPPIPKEWLWIFGGSQSVYLGEKLGARIWKKNS